MKVRMFHPKFWLSFTIEDHRPLAILQLKEIQRLLIISLLLIDVEVAQLVSVFLGSNNAQEITQRLLLQVLLREVLQETNIKI